MPSRVRVDHNQAEIAELERQIALGESAKSAPSAPIHYRHSPLPLGPAPSYYNEFVPEPNTTTLSPTPTPTEYALVPNVSRGGPHASNNFPKKIPKKFSIASPTNQFEVLANKISAAAVAAAARGGGVAYDASVNTYNSYAHSVDEVPASPSPSPSPSPTPDYTVADDASAHSHQYHMSPSLAEASANDTSRANNVQPAPLPDDLVCDWSTLPCCVTAFVSGILAGLCMPAPHPHHHPQHTHAHTPPLPPLLHTYTESHMHVSFAPTRAHVHTHISKALLLH